MNGWRFSLPLWTDTGSVLSLLFASQSKGGRLGMPAHVTSQHPNCLVAVFIDPHSRVNPGNTWATVSGSGTGEGHSFSVCMRISLVKKFWGWCPGAAQSPKKALQGTNPILLGNGIAPVPPLHPHHTSVLGLTCGGASLPLLHHSSDKISYNDAGWNLFRHKAGFASSCTEKNSFLLSSPANPSPPQQTNKRIHTLDLTVYVHSSH